MPPYPSRPDPKLGEAVEPLVLNPIVVTPRLQRILVIRLGAMGDVARTLPAVALLRDRLPEARIDWLLEERTASIVAERAFVDRAVVFPRAELMAGLRRGRVADAGRRFGVFVRALRAGRYDAVLDFHAIARSAALGALSGAPVRVGYARPHAREGADRLSTHRVRLARLRVSRFDRNEALVSALVGPGAPRRTHPLEVAPAAREAMAAQLGDGLRPVILHPGSSAAAAYKRWPPHRFAQLARALAEEGERVLVARGPAAQEREIAREVVDASSGAAALAPETADFEALAALLASGRAVVAADSGPLHVASLVGTPVVQLVGPTDEIENEPWRETPFERVVTGLGCRGCRSGCAAAACMQGIDARAVRRALRRLIAPPGRHLQLVSASAKGA